MGEFTAEITERLRSITEELRLAEAAGDDFGVQSHGFALDDLRRIAAEHGVPEDGVAEQPGVTGQQPGVTGPGVAEPF
ncbi:MAG: hypothetical protein ACRDYU_10795 [Actinomycetes bacterium]